MNDAATETHAAGSELAKEFPEERPKDTLLGILLTVGTIVLCAGLILTVVYPSVYTAAVAILGVPLLVGALIVWNAQVNHMKQIRTTRWPVESISQLGAGNLVSYLVRLVGIDEPVEVYFVTPVLDAPASAEFPEADYFDDVRSFGSEMILYSGLDPATWTDQLPVTFVEA